MATLKKLNNKWQAQVRMRGVRKARSFTKKQLASSWASKVETEIINGTYQYQSELVKMKLIDLLELFYDHKKHEKNYVFIPIHILEISFSLLLCNA